MEKTHNKSNHSPPPPSRPMPSQTLSNSCFGETPSQFIAKCDIMWNGQFGQLRAAVPDVFPHNTSPTPCSQGWE